MVFVVADIEMAILWSLQETDLNVTCCRLMLVECFSGKEVRCMPDMEKVKVLTSLLEERSGIDVREALIRYYDFLTDDEAWDYDFELDFLLNKFNIEVDIPF